MTNFFADKVAVVTGAASGLGAATARQLSAEGASVVVVDIDEAGARSVASQLPGPALAVRADVAREEDVLGYFEAALDRFGRVDLHHLNAGIVGSFAPFPEFTTADFDQVVGINLRGVFLGIREAFRQYARQHATSGAIVLTASIASLRGSHDLIAYQASKHGVLGLLRGAAMYGGPLGVRVNAVAPGLVPTGLFAAAADESGGANDMAQRGSTVPLRRTGQPSEVADLVTYLLSDRASYVTGEVVSVDGGSQMVSTVRPGGGAGKWDTSAIDQEISAAEQRASNTEPR